jgi:hypothetical protein
MAPIDDITKALAQAIIDALKDREDELKDIAAAGADKTGGGAFDGLGTLMAIIEPLIAVVALTAPELLPAIEGFKQVEGSSGKLGEGFGIGWVLGNLGFNALNPLMIPINNAVGNAVQTGVFDPETAAQLQARGIINDAYGRSEAAGGNLSGEHYDKLVDSVQMRPAMPELFDMWNRGLIAEDDVTTGLQHSTLPPYWYPMVKELRWQLLSGADLALANLRGEMDDATLAKYAARIGVQPDDMATLIANTGEPPGPEQLMEAIRRGFIDRDRFTRGIRQSRVRDEWVDVEYALRESPMSISDAIRAVVENYLTDDEGKAIAVQNGLIADHWEVMRESWGRPLSQLQMVQLYHRGLVTEDEVLQAGRESDIKDKYIGYATELGRRLVPERQITQMLQHNVIDRATAHIMLVQQGYNDADAEALINLGTSQRLNAHRELSRTDIVAMYENSLLTEVQARDHLISLGYPLADADQMLKLADVKAKASLLRATQKAIEASFRAHHLTATEAKNQLERAGMDAHQAQGLIDEWSMVRGAEVRSLTEAQILSLGEHGLISPEDTLARLVGYGLAPADAALLLELHGIGTKAA